MQLYCNSISKISKCKKLTRDKVNKLFINSVNIFKSLNIPILTVNTVCANAFY